MKSFTRKYFLLRKGERQALIFAAILVCGSMIFRSWITRRPYLEHAFDQEFKTEMLHLLHELDSLDNHQKHKTKEFGVANAPVDPEPFIFDPNTITDSALRSMNLPGRIIQNLSSYRSAGGSFKRKEDLKKIYGMDSSLYHRLEGFIIIRETLSPPDTLDLRIRQKTIEKISINSADSADLLSLPGIGPVFASRITRYRDLLGGYYNHSQLLEVYGMDSVRLNRIGAYIIFDTLNINKIDLRSAGFNELISHPYINKAETYSILQFRDFADSITNAQLLLDNQIIEPDRFERIRAYIE